MESQQQDMLSLTTDLQQLASQEKDKEALLEIINAVQKGCKELMLKIKSYEIDQIVELSQQPEPQPPQQQPPPNLKMTKSLEEFADDILISNVKKTGLICGMALYSTQNYIEVDKKCKYIIALDSLDGVCNKYSNAPLGTIFCIWERKTKVDIGLLPRDFFIYGSELIAAGYCIYGTSTQFVFTYDNNKPVRAYGFDSQVNDFILFNDNVKISNNYKFYSINECNAHQWDQTVEEFIFLKKSPQDGEKGLVLRYIGTLVADLHRTLFYGGIFLYPEDKINNVGRLKLLFECFPFALIFERAGGKAICKKQQIKNLQILKLHQTGGFITGVKEEVNQIEQMYKNQN